jgi:hypothetical protein
MRAGRDKGEAVAWSGRIGVEREGLRTFEGDGEDAE